MSRPNLLAMLIHPEVQDIVDNFRELFVSEAAEQLVVILRGMPGSGKTTFASFMEIYARAWGFQVRVCSAEHFFMGPRGYNFVPELMSEAHDQCRERFGFALEDRVEVVILDNTCISHREWQWYEVAVGGTNAIRLGEQGVHGFHRSISLVKVQFAWADHNAAQALNRRRHDLIDRRFASFLHDSERFAADYVIAPISHSLLLPAPIDDEEI